MLNILLSASIGCFTGLVFTLVTRAGGIKGAILDALLGTAGAFSMAWFLSPIPNPPMIRTA